MHYLAADFRKFQNERTNYYKIPATFRGKILGFHTDFADVGAKIFKISEIQNFDKYPAIYSGRSRKMLKNGALISKIGVDTADILAI